MTEATESQFTPEEALRSTIYVIDFFFIFSELSPVASYSIEDR